MHEEINLHSGHRERMREKLLQNPDSLSEHELLEILLYQFIPRKNTNELAHNLLRYFGNLGNLIKSSAEDLSAVPGVGEKTAVGITLFSAICRKCSGKTEEKGRVKFSFEAFRTGVVSYFSGKNEEEFLVILLNDKNKEICRTSFEDRKEAEVFVDLSVVAKILAINKPTYVIIAHNHPSGLALPSANDDVSTVKVNALCSIHGATLVDHIIVAGKDSYSYFIGGRMEFLKKQCNIDRYISGLKETDLWKK